MNPELRAPPATPDLFPMDAAWVDLHHDKGQLGRAPAHWGRALIHARLAAGESPIELAVHCWIMGAHGSQLGNPCFDELLRIAPEAGLAFAEIGSARSALAAIGARFDEAAANWEPPLDPALRGWGKSRPDEQIRDGSRARFACLGWICRKANEAGLPRAIELSALGDSSWRERPAGAPELQAPSWNAGTLARALASSFAASRSIPGGPGADDREGRAAALLSLCARTLPPRGFSRALSQLCPDHLEIARSGGRACAAALDACAAEAPLLAALGAAQAARAAWDARGSDGGDELDDSKGELAPPDAPAPPLPVSIPGARWVEEARARMGRARNALWKVASLCAQAEPAGPGALAALAEAFAGFPASDPRSGAAASARIASTAGGMQHLAGSALALAEGFELAGSRWHPSPQARAAAWTSHLSQFESMRMADIPKAFAARHLALASRFAHDAFEARSLALAPPKALAEIELLLLSKATLRYEPEADSEPDGPGGEEPVGAEPPRATRRARL